MHLKQRSDTETEEPKAKKGGIAGEKEKTKPVELKPASAVSQVSQEQKASDAGRAEGAAPEESEKRPHTPRSGIVLKSAEEAQQSDAGEKAPHRVDSSEDDDVTLAAELQRASSVAGTSRKGARGSDDPRSDEGMYGDDARSKGTPSAVTVSGVDDDPYAPSQVSRISNSEEAGKRRRKSSKTRLAKKAARTRRKGRRSPPRSEVPRDEQEDEDDEGFDPALFQKLQGVIPESDTQELLTEAAGLVQGYKAQSVSARSHASKMESLMLQVGRQAMVMKEQAEEDRRLMQKENNLLKRTLGLVTTHQPAIAAAAARQAGRTSEDRSEDPDVRSRPGSTRRR